MHAPPAARPISPGLTFLFAAACALSASTLYFSQPLTPLIAAELGIPHGMASLVVTVTQLGYGVGLVTLGPLGDLLENRRLVVCVMASSVVALLAAALARTPVMFFAASLALGITSSVIQILVPFAAHLAQPERRGRTVGTVMSGLMVGLLLGRPVASVVAQHLGWRVVFGAGAGAIALMALLLARLLPVRDPRATIGYGRLLRSLLTLIATVPELRRRAAYQALMFGAFSLFWTAVPLHLAARFGLDQDGIALFALAGAGGALAAPLAGRVADRGWTRPATAVAMLLALAAFAAAGLRVGGGAGLLALAACAVLLDAAVQSNVVLSQRLLYTLGADIRARLNGVFIALFFMGGAAGSAAAGPLFASGWGAVALAGAALPALALLLYAAELATGRRPAPAALERCGP